MIIHCSHTDRDNCSKSYITRSRLAFVPLWQTVPRAFSAVIKGSGALGEPLDCASLVAIAYDSIDQFLSSTDTKACSINPA